MDVIIFWNSYGVWGSLELTYILKATKHILKNFITASGQSFHKHINYVNNERFITSQLHLKDKALKR